MANRFNAHDTIDSMIIIHGYNDGSHFHIDLKQRKEKIHILNNDYDSMCDFYNSRNIQYHRNH